MIALPWYLLSVGLILVVVGFLLTGLNRPSRSRERWIDPRLKDEEIHRLLRDTQRMPLPSLVILAGLACILVSIVWRLALSFL